MSPARALAVIAILCGVLCGCSSSTSSHATDAMSDEEFVRYLLTGATPFTREKLVPGARIAVYYVSSNERNLRSLEGRPLMCGGDPMYVNYDLPLPPGAAAGATGAGVGILDMGKITPIVEWRPMGRESWTLRGCLGRLAVVSRNSSPDKRFIISEPYVISGGKLVRAGDDLETSKSEFGTYPGLSRGATCHIARAGHDFYLEATSRAGSSFRLIDAPELDTALKGFEKRPHIQVSCFRFAQRDFVQVGSESGESIIYRIDRGALTLIGVGNVLGGDANHLLLEFDNVERAWFNEEKV
ncbi:MAG TPA: hypothetical protein VID24_08150 [Candidatus Eremiobacteraceae bacterium]|jgi:hypothetical protein